MSEVIRLLRALDVETATAADVNAIIGNNTWASLTCDGCGEDKYRILRLGDEPDYEARWQDLCLDCLEDAKNQLEASLG
jgi:hypothetical protein